MTTATEHGTEVAWRDDVVLESWIDVEDESAHIRLEGTLNGPTSANLVLMVERLLEHGYRWITLHTAGLQITDGTAAASLIEIDEMAREVGGRVYVFGAAMPNRFGW